MDLPSIPHESFGSAIGSPMGAPDESGAAAAGGPPVPTTPDLVADSVVSRPLAERMSRASADDVIGVVIEVNTDHPGGTRGATGEVVTWLAEIAPSAHVRRGMSSVSSYVSAGLTCSQIQDLVKRDQQESREQLAARARESLLLQGALAAPTPAEEASRQVGTSRPTPRWAVHRIWPNFEVKGLIHRSVVTTKCDASRRAFDATGSGIVWAVLDSGIQADHEHFATHRNLELPGQLEHRSFVGGSADPLVDESGHGTHVAGILAGEQRPEPGQKLVASAWYQDENTQLSGVSLELEHIAGMAPMTTLLSCQILRRDGSGDVAALLDALEYISELNQGGRELNVHGVNLSVGYPFDPAWFGTGLTPVCREVDRLVRSGVVVVAAAGNSGYGYALDDSQRQMRLGFAMTINDPGNADRAITVGSTSTRPHSTGISYFSSKGPTGDGRLKPDIVAPGERVVSAGAGDLVTRARGQSTLATYVEDSGTSMAAPHVSGVAAGFLSVHREFIGRPEEVKRILMDTATDLSRIRTFQGMGLVDSMRAIQSV